MGIAGFVAARQWWRSQELHPSTDDALLNAHVVAIRPQIAGEVVAVHVVENQRVKKGEVLFEIDPRPFGQAVQQAEAAVVVTKADVAADAATIAAAKAAAESAKAAVALYEARSEYQKVIHADTNRLAAAGEATPKELASAKADLDEAAARLSQARLQLAEAEAQVDVLVKRVGDPASEQARIARDESSAEIQRIRLAWATVRAPADGHITSFDLRPGQVVAAGETLFYLIESQEWWIDANFKETQLARIRPGMPASFTVDMYPGRVFTGTVESVSRGSANAFSLLPPENATGNWVKVTQRVTARIRTKDEQPEAPLRKGASVSVTVDTTAPARESSAERADDA